MKIVALIDHGRQLKVVEEILTNRAVAAAKVADGGSASNGLRRPPRLLSPSPAS
jgi:hypothetical protein